MSNFWKPFVRVIQDTEDVAAQVANRPIQDQMSREEYLFGMLQSLSLSAGRVVRSNVPVTPDTEVNDIVYFDSSLGQYAPALAEVTYVDGEVQATKRSFAVGMVLATSGGFGDILRFGDILTDGQSGQFTIDPLSMLDTNESALVDGIYYLSRKQPGKISSVPAAPLVQLGWFGEGAILFFPIYKGLLETHFHYAFDLYARPSASQNYTRTGWHQFAGDDTNQKFVDYFYRGTNTAPPAIIATIRWAGSAEPAAVRIQIWRSSATEFSVSLNNGDGLDYTNPASVAGTVVDIPAAAWPDYGQYVAIGSTGLEVAFLRRDGDYANSLTVDAAALLTLNTDTFLFFLPNDLQGWTNVNSFDIDTPTGALYRYVTEGQTSLYRAFPPLPLESAILEKNGTGLQAGVDFDITLGGIWWIPTDTVAPWPTDFMSDGSGMDPANACNLLIAFSRSTSSNQNSEVQSLKSLSPALVIKSCPEGLDAETGNLTISLDLALSVDDTVVEGQDLALVGVSGETFKVGPVVTELVAGTGILLERISSSLIAGSSRLTGKVRISRKDVNLEGEVSSIALRNAKEILKDNFAYVSFPAPSRSTSSIIARFKLPNAGLTQGEFSLNLYAQALGSSDSAILSNAIFKVTFQALRPGLSLVDLTDEKAMAIHYWTVPFGPNYTAFSLLSGEMPIPPSGSPEAYILTTDSMQSLSTIKISGGLQDGDVVSVTIKRMLADLNGVPDNYDGDVGFAGIRWALTA